MSDKTDPFADLSDVSDEASASTSSDPFSDLSDTPDPFADLSDVKEPSVSQRQKEFNEEYNAGERFGMRLDAGIENWKASKSLESAIMFGEQEQALEEYGDTKRTKTSMRSAISGRPGEEVDPVTGSPHLGMDRKPFVEQDPEKSKALAKNARRIKEEELERYMKSSAEAAKVPQTPVTEAAMDAETLGEAIKHVMVDPIGFIADTGVRSLPFMVEPMVGAIVGGAAGGPAGFVAGTGMGSFSADHAAQLSEGLHEMGVDITNPDAVRAALADRETLQKIKSDAKLHAAAVGMFDAITAGIATKTIAPKAISNKLGRELVNVVAQTQVQGAGGAAGEALGTHLIGREQNYGEILGEYAGEMITGPTDVAAATVAGVRGDSKVSTDPNKTGKPVDILNKDKGGPRDDLSPLYGTPEQGDINSIESESGLTEEQRNAYRAGDRGMSTPQEGPVDDLEAVQGEPIVAPVDEGMRLGMGQAAPPEKVSEAGLPGGEPEFEPITGAEALELDLQKRDSQELAQYPGKVSIVTDDNRTQQKQPEPKMEAVEYQEFDREHLIDPMLAYDDVRSELQGELSRAEKGRHEKTDKIDETADDILTAIAKAGGLSREESEAQGIDPAYFNENKPVKGKALQPVFRKSGGKTFDEMAETLAQYGYGSQEYSANEMLDMVDRALSGENLYSINQNPDLIIDAWDDQTVKAVKAAMAGRVLGKRQRQIVDSILDDVAERRDQRIERVNDEYLSQMDPALRVSVEQTMSEVVDSGEFTVEDIEQALPLAGFIAKAVDAGVDEEVIDAILEKDIPDSDIIRKLNREIDHETNPDKRSRQGAATEAEENQGQQSEANATAQARQEAGEGDGGGNVQEGLGFGLSSPVGAVTRAAPDVAPAPARDLFGEAPIAEQALADHQREVNERLAGEDVPAESAGDLFDQGREKQADIEEAAKEAATHPANDLPEPTDAQKEAGNYKKGHVTLYGLDVAIENPKGSIRAGTDEDGKAWEVRMQHHYGYIKGTEGNDGDHIDVFIGPEGDKPDRVFVINQVDPKTRKFDEHKVVFGAKTEKQAEEIYLSNYEDGWDGVDAVINLTVDSFKGWLAHGDLHKKAESDETIADLLGTNKAENEAKPKGKKDAVAAKAGEDMLDSLAAVERDETLDGEAFVGPVETHKVNYNGEFIDVTMTHKPDLKADTHYMGFEWENGYSLEELEVSPKLQSVGDLKDIAVQVIDEYKETAAKKQAEKKEKSSEQIKAEEDEVRKALGTATQAEPAPLYTEGEYTALGKIFKTRVFNTDEDANAYMESNGEWSLIGIKDGKPHLARTDDKGAAKKGAADDSPVITTESLEQYAIEKINEIVEKKDTGYYTQSVKEVESTDFAIDQILGEHPAVQNRRSDTEPFRQYVEAKKSIDKGRIRKAVIGTEEIPTFAEDAKKKEYGDQNKLVSKERAAEIERKLKEKLGTLHSGVDPEMIAMGTELAVYHIEAGARSFADYSTKMLETFGDNIKPYLRSFYEGARYFPGLDNEGMTPAAEIKEQDVEKPDLSSAIIEDRKQEQEDDLFGYDQEYDRGAGPKTVSTDESVRGAGEGSGRVQGESDRGQSPGRISDEDNNRDTKRGRSGARNERGGTTGARNRGQRDSGGSQGPVRTNYRITEEDSLGVGSPLQKARANVEAIRIVKQLKEEQRNATREEQAKLVKYTGWGASELANKLFPTKGKPEGSWGELHDTLRDLLTEAELKTAARSTQYAHYTSKPIIDGIYQAVEKFGFKHGLVYEGGVGTGNFIGLVPENMNVSYAGVEMDGTSADIAKALYPEAGIVEGDFTKQGLPQNHFDMTIGNPPYASIKVKYKDSKYLLHDYFIIKQVDALRPGGIAVFVTSKGTMDKIDSEARNYLADNANLLGAIRLPQTAFKENAGTEVVTDVLFFQKYGDGVPAQDASWTETKETAIDGEKVHINQYYLDNPGMVLGEFALTGTMYRSNELTVEPTGDINEQLSEAIKALPADVFSNDKSIEELEAKARQIDMNPRDKEASYYIDAMNNLRLVQDGVGVIVPVRGGKQRTGRSKKQAQILRDYIPLRDAVMEVYYQQANDGDWKTAQKDLHRAYDTFVAKNGPINQVKVIKRKDGKEIVTEPVVSTIDGDPEAYRVIAIEHYDEATNTATKGHIFTDNVMARHKEAEIETAIDALNVTLNERGYVDMDYLVERYGQNLDETLSELGDAVFKDPTSGHYVTADDYLSGNVKAKLAVAKEEVEENPEYQHNIIALEEVQPADLDISRIPINLGAMWISKDIVHKFATEVMGFNGRIDSFISKENSAWSVKGTTGDQRYGTSRMNAVDVLDSALNKRTIKIYDHYRENGKDKRQINRAETSAANQKAQELKEAFSGWAVKDAESAETLHYRYNRDFNTTVPRKYNGQHLTLPRLSSRYKPHAWQRNAVWRILQNGNTYMAHEVGAGKTLASAIAGMEMRRLGLAKKPGFVVLKSTLKQFATELLDAYPDAKILVADEKQLDKKNRRRFLARMASEDWDAVILTHQSFEKISLSPEFVAEHINTMLSEYRATLEEVDEQDRASRKTIERQIETLENRLEEATSQDRKDAGITFEETGLDFLFVDEAHHHKKIPFPTSQTNVKGVDPNGSGIAMDLFMKAQYMDAMRPGHNLVLMSGTPVTNTLGEVFNIQRYLQPHVLENNQISSFDSWSATFADTVTELEMQANGAFKPVTRLARFVGVPALLRDFLQVADIVTSDDLKDSLTIKRPAVGGGLRQIIAVERTPEMRKYQDELSTRITALENKKGPPKKGEDNILVVIGDAKKAAIDLRLVGRQQTQPSKLDMMIDDVYQTWKDTKDDVYRNKGKIEPKKGSTQLIFTEIIESHGFNIYDHIRDELVRRGVPQREIAFIQEATNSNKKKRLFKDMNTGVKRIMIGGSKNMGTGTNVQQRIKRLNHLDIDYLPANIVQREGRAIRQGNKNDEVTLAAYATEGTVDAFMWQLNETKQRMIDQVMAGDLSLDSVEDVSESANQMAMAKALASGNPLLLEQAGISSEVKRLEGLKEAHINQVFKANQSIKYYEKTLPVMREQYEELKALSTQHKETKGDKFRMTIKGKNFTERAKAGDYLLATLEGFKNRRDHEEVIGELGGYEITARGRTGGYEAGPYGANDVSTPLGGGTLYRGGVVGSGLLADDSSVGTIRRLENAAKSLVTAHEAVDTAIQATEKKLSGLKNDATAVFQYDNELKAKTERLAEIEKELGAEAEVVAEVPTETAGEPGPAPAPESSAIPAAAPAPEPAAAAPEPTPAPAGNKTLADYGIKVTKTKTNKGTEVYEVSGDTRTHKDAIKRAGGRWYGPKKVWSFYTDADPSEKILTAIDGPRFKAAAVTGMPHADVIAAASDIERSLGLVARVSVLPNENKLPDGVKAEAESQGVTGKVQGVFWRGKVYVVSEHIPSAQALEETILHELAGHYGARKLFGANVVKAYRGLFVKLGGVPGIRRMAEKHGINMDNEFKHAKTLSDLEAAVFLADEFIAHMQGAKAYDSLPAKVIRAIKELYGALRRQLSIMGLNRIAKLNDADLAYLLKKMRDAVMEVDNSNIEDGKPVFHSAWHGTPHDVDKFSSENIGTGEGAQAFGWGLYFTDSEDVANWYRTTTNNKAFEAFNIQEELENNGVEDPGLLLSYAVYDASGDMQKAVDSFYEMAQSHEDDSEHSAYTEMMQAHADAVKAIDNGLTKIDVNKGNVYQVELAPKEDEYLLWDKTIAEQTETVKGLLALDGGYSASLDRSTAEGWTGMNLYKITAEQYGSEEAASKAMHDIGIRGIKYLDGTSRDKGEGGYNYVIFNDDDIEITARFNNAESGKVSKETGVSGLAANMVMKALDAQPVDKAFRAPFSYVNNLAATKAGKRKLAEGYGAAMSFYGEKMPWLHPVVKTIAAGVIDRYGLDPQYVRLDESRMNTERGLLLEVVDLLEDMEKIGVDNKQDAEIFQAILTGEDVAPDKWSKLTKEIRGRIDDLGARAVELNLISKESYERNKGSYLHRVYKKYEDQQTWMGKNIEKMYSGRQKKIIGSELKGRGIFVDVPSNSVKRSDWFGSRQEKSAADASLVGRKVHIIDLVEDGALEGVKEMAKVKDRMFVEGAVPDELKGGQYIERGEFTVRSAHKDELTLWRDYTKDERERMGEIVDARYTLAKTFRLMAHDLASAEFFNEVARNEEWTWQGNEPPANVDEEPSTARLASGVRTFAGVDWVRVPKTKVPGTDRHKYGDLAGRFVRSEIWRDITQVEFMHTRTGWDKVMSFWKLNKTARNPVVHMNNVMSNLILMDMADVRFSDLLRAIDHMRKRDDAYRDAEAHGAFGHSFIEQDIKRDVLDEVMKELNDQARGDKGFLEGTAAEKLDGMPLHKQMAFMAKMLDILHKYAKKTDNYTQSAYQWEDEVFRMATYVRNIDQGMDKVDAAIDARDQFLNYDIRAPWINAMRRTFFPFISYTYRAVPVIAKSLAHRPWKLAKYYTLSLMINALGYMLAGGDEDEDRKYMRDEQKGRTWIGTHRMIRMPFDYKGDSVMLDVRRFVPAGDVFDMHQSKDALGIVPAPLVPGGPLGMFWEFAINKSMFTGKPLVNDKADSLGMKVRKLADWQWKAWTPGAQFFPGSWHWDNIATASRGGQNIMGDAMSPGLALAGSFGVKLRPMDNELNRTYRGFDIETRKNAIKNEIRNLNRQYLRKKISKGEYEQKKKDYEDNLGRLKEEAMEQLQ